MLERVFESAFSVEVVLKATAVLAVTAGLVALRPRAPAAARHAIRAAALASMVAMPLLVGLLPRIAIRVVTEAAGKEQTPPQAPVRPAILHRVRDASSQPAIARTSLALPESTTPLPAATARPAVSSSALLGLVWAAGALLALAGVVASMVRARLLLRGARPLEEPLLAEAAVHLGIGRHVRLYETAHLAVPVTLGAVTPRVLVPAGFASWDAERKTVVLLHELAHVKRLDWLAQIAASVAAALWWFNPLASRTALNLRRDAEEAADDLVLAQGTRPSDYAGHLVAIARAAERREIPVAAVLSMAGSPLEARIRAILEPARPRRAAASGARRIAALTPVMAGVLLLASMSVSAGPPEPIGASPVEAKAKDKDKDKEKDKAQYEKDKDHDQEKYGREERYARNTERDLDAWSPRRGSEWFAKGYALHHDRRYADAVEAWQKAFDLGFREDTAAYNMACAHARLGHTDLAIEWLKRAREEGFDLAEYLMGDSDLRSLRTDPRFQELRAEERAHLKEQGREPMEEEGAKALRRLERLEQKGSKDGDAFYEVGMELHNAEEYKAAVRAWERSAALTGGREAASTYNIACARSLAGDTSGALDALEQAVDLGFGDPRSFDRDDDLDPIRDEPRFKEIRAMSGLLELPDDAFGWWGDHGKRREPRTSRAEWQAALAGYERYLAAHPKSGRAWSAIGIAKLRTAEPAAAADAFKRAFELGYRKDASAYNVACGLAQKGDRDGAFQWLDRAFAEGLENPGLLGNDHDLDALRDDPRFDAVERAHSEDWSEKLGKWWKGGGSKGKHEHGKHHGGSDDEGDDSDTDVDPDVER